MNAKVLIKFTDKYTGKEYAPGDIIKGISAARFNEILKAGKFIEAAEDVKETPAKNEK